MPKYEIIPYQDYLEGISALRFRTEENWVDAPLHDNPWGIFQYHGHELFKKVVKFPIGAFDGGKAVGFTSIYNISDTTLRLGGVYMAPEARGKGVGLGMCEFATSLWPKEWNRLIGYYRNDSFMRVTRSWGMKEFPRHYWRYMSKNNGLYFNYKVILAFKDLSDRKK